MSASNGGRGRPPVPPEGHGPREKVRIGATIIQPSLGVECDRNGEGLILSVLVTEGGELIRRTFEIGENGKATIRAAVNGGIETATADQMPGARDA